MLKGLLSFGIALVIAVIAVKLILFLFKITFIFASFISTLLFLGLVAIFTLPLFVIVKKKLLN